MDSPHGAPVITEDFGLKGPRGWAFRGVDIDARPGSLIAVEGPSGSGRTCLLLALTGRMRPTEGRAEIGGLQLPRKMAAVRRISALGPVPGISDLDPALTVAEHLRERALLQRRFDSSLRTLLRPRAEHAAAARGRIDEALEAAGLDLATLPKEERTAVRDLERLEELRLSIALALIGRPRLLAVDDIDLKLSDTERAEVWKLLGSLAESGTTVFAVCSQAPEGTTVIRTTGRSTVDAATAAAADADTEAVADTGTDADAEAEAEAEAKVEAAALGDTDRDTDTGADADADDTNKDTNEEGTADALADTGRA
ncbi:ATP-binding cassette domain-containing protein [Streptomyces sp. NBC_01142]|uniref:ATP-binding cassette domain-containing protein n=1 Tax=Streptomyces sp. NBC_01142 TaxID=2975865 RepID=UPI00224E3076|nr:ATP-binding cassette domain-containing protein [Streptomyces sp. NBC_01142]MCX4822489.1 ATP-binding cassette domain-containing protein [Streptomyces sp. NBC_01142]